MISETQLNILLQDLYQDHSLDFYFYSRESFIRRLIRMVKLDVVSDFEDLRSRLKQSPGYVEHFVDRITVNVTDMFRDPIFFGLCGRRSSQRWLPYPRSESGIPAARAEKKYYHLPSF